MNLEEKLAALLDKKRFQHSLRVSGAAQALARRYGADVEKAGIAGLLHDCARFLSPKQMLRSAQKTGRKISNLEYLEPKLLHAALSAQFARTKFKVKDKEILRAIKFHTLGRPKMTKLEKIIYLADHLESGRRFKDVKKIRKLSYKNLNQAVAEVASAMLKFLIDKNLPACGSTLITRNYYLLNK